MRGLDESTELALGKECPLCSNMEALLKSIRRSNTGATSTSLNGKHGLLIKKLSTIDEIKSTDDLSAEENKV